MHRCYSDLFLGNSWCNIGGATVGATFVPELTLGTGPSTCTAGLGGLPLPEGTCFGVGRLTPAGLEPAPTAVMLGSANLVPCD
jgi:hypothetical protein